MKLIEKAELEKIEMLTVKNSRWSKFIRPLLTFLYVNFN